MHGARDMGSVNLPFHRRAPFVFRNQSVAFKYFVIDALTEFS
jgi:hypothetical protein